MERLAASSQLIGPISQMHTVCLLVLPDDMFSLKQDQTAKKCVNDQQHSLQYFCKLCACLCVCVWKPWACMHPKHMHVCVCTHMCPHVCKCTRGYVCVCVCVSAWGLSKMGESGLSTLSEQRSIDQICRFLILLRSATSSWVGLAPRSWTLLIATKNDLLWVFFNFLPKFARLVLHADLSLYNCVDLHISMQ